jgi:hypothetical protein
VSQENVEIVRGIARAVNDGDVDYIIRHTAEDIVLLMARSAVEGPYLGHDGMRKWLADNRQNFEIYEVHEEEVRAIGDDRVLSVGTIHVRGRGGGVETDLPFAGITTFCERRVSRWEDFRERHLALKAVGLEE